ncbi:MAG: peptide-methionine (R)-S-oxide reductase MsrB [Paracoccaceae bacterium]
MSIKIEKTDAQWRAELPELTYKVTRKGKTERAFSHDDFPKTGGIFHCVCCDTPLFDGATKFDSGTGWPSFFQPISADVIEERADNTLFMRRTEVICANCAAHLGHVFPDGPKPTGQRYCLNGVALAFNESLID